MLLFYEVRRAFVALQCWNFTVTYQPEMSMLYIKRQPWIVWEVTFAWHWLRGESGSIPAIQFCLIKTTIPDSSTESWFLIGTFKKNVLTLYLLCQYARGKLRMIKLKRISEYPNFCLENKDSWAWWLTLTICREENNAGEWRFWSQPGLPRKF